MTDLAAWLLAAIAKDEADAREASGERLWRWSQHGDMVIADSGHMQRFTPARMLAECAAKRRIILRHRPTGGIGCECSEVWPCPNLLDLAQPYADRPGYRAEWKP